MLQITNLDKILDMVEIKQLAHVAPKNTALSEHPDLFSSKVLHKNRTINLVPFIWSFSLLTSMLLLAKCSASSHLVTVIMLSTGVISVKTHFQRGPETISPRIEATAGVTLIITRPAWVHLVRYVIYYKVLNWCITTGWSGLTQNDLNCPYTRDFSYMVSC